MRDLIRRDADNWLERFFGLKNWMFGWDDELTLDKSLLSGNLITQNFKVSNDKDRFAVKAELPGYTRRDIRVKTEKGILSVEGKRETKKEENKNGCYRYENSFQSFQRRFSLPKETDAKTLKTSFKGGKLVIGLAKKEGK